MFFFAYGISKERKMPIEFFKSREGLRIWSPGISGWFMLNPETNLWQVRTGIVEGGVFARIEDAKKLCQLLNQSMTEHFGEVFLQEFCRDKTEGRNEEILSGGFLKGRASDDRDDRQCENGLIQFPKTHQARGKA